MDRDKYIINVNKDLCIGCSLCVKDCPINNIILEDNKSVVKDQDCLKCGHCLAVCPKHAITMTDFDEDPIEFDKTPVVDSEQLLLALKSRRSVRKFIDKKISDDIIDKIIQAGRYTPTAKNKQDVSYIVLRDNKKEYEDVAVNIMRKIKPIASIWMKDAREVQIDDSFFFKKAPVVILVVCKNKTNGLLASSNMSLMAESYGLGVLNSGFFTEIIKYSFKLKRKLGLGSRDHVVSALVMGYPGVKYRRTALKKSANVRFI